MFNVSNYYQQSEGLPIKNSFQLTLLQWTDASTVLRETSKCGAVTSLVVSASSLIFNFDPTIALTCTAISGVSWLLTRTCAQKLEPEAKKLIEDLKNEKAYVIKRHDSE